MVTGEQDDRVDRLYQLPLDEFTAARNALARVLGSAGATVKGLEKPNLAAWTVNQVYWHRRASYDALVAAAEALRAAYRLQLSGKAADVPAAETAIAETFEALPGTELPGRLSRPLRRVGFGALEGLAFAIRPAARPKPSSSTASTSAHRMPAAEARHAREEEARERTMLRERLRFAEAAEREAEAARERASRAIARADRTCDRLKQELADATEAAADACAATLRAAIAERERLAAKLD